MNLNTQAELNDRLRQGIELARQGQREKAYVVFSEITKLQPTNEQALVWKAAVTSNIAETINCLETVLKLNPQNMRAKAGLAWAKKQTDEGTVTAIAPKAEPVVAIRVAKGAPRRETINEIPPKSAQNETKSDIAPYKKSRLVTREIEERPKVAASVPEPTKPKGSKGRTTRGRKKPDTHRVESTVMRAAMPKIALRISEKVRRSTAGEFTESSPTRIALVWPLLFFLLALGLVLFSFIVVSLAPIFGVLALLVTLAGVFTLNQADI
jgi:hypothetical protein